MGIALLNRSAYFACLVSQRDMLCIAIVMLPHKGVQLRFLLGEAAVARLVISFRNIFVYSSFVNVE